MIHISTIGNVDTAIVDIAKVEIIIGGDAIFARY